MDTNTTRKRDFLLGLIFFGTVGMLLYYTVILTGFSFSDKTYLQVSFPGASGLKTGDVVLVSGHQFGNVSSVSFRDDQPDDRRIYVEMEFDSPVTLRRGYQIQISEFTMLGGRVVEVFPGHFSSPILPDGVKLIGQVGPSALAAMGQLVSENRDDLRAIVSNLRTWSCFFYMALLMHRRSFLLGQEPYVAPCAYVDMCMKALYFPKETLIF